MAVAETAAGAAPVSPTEPISPTSEGGDKQLSGDELKEAVKKQVEYYFSRSNLQSDAYLVSQMDAQMFVPLDVIASFKGVQKLTMDLETIVESVTTSEHLVLDRSGPYVKLRPNVTSERTTLILREIPQATPEADVKALFGESASEIQTIKSEIGDNWYVHFNTEKAATAAHEHLTFGGVTFNGGPVRARIKSESIIRSFYAQQGKEASAVPAQMQHGSGKGYGGKGNNYGKGGYYPQAVPVPNGGMYYTADIDPSGGQQGRGRGGRGKGGRGMPMQPMYGMQQGYPQPFQMQYMQQGQMVQGQGHAGQPGTAGAAGAAVQLGKGKKKGKMKQGKGEASVPPQVGIPGKQQAAAPPPMSADDFPALPASPGAGEKKVGYTQPFKAYGVKEISEIVSQMTVEENVEPPAGIPEESQCKATKPAGGFESFAAAAAANAEA